MPPELPAGLLTVRELREALDSAHPDQLVIFSVSADDLADLGAALSAGLDIIFAVKVRLASPTGPVFGLASARPQPAS